MEFESFSEGDLLYIGIKEGETAPVDSLLAILGNKGEDISKLIQINDDNNDDDNNEKKIAESNVKSEKKVEDSKLSLSDVSKQVEIITMPRLSDTMEEGTVAKWFKKVGDSLNGLVIEEKIWKLFQLSRECSDGIKNIFIFFAE